MQCPISRVSLFMALAVLVFSCKKEETGGCTVYYAQNYNPDATYDDGSCVYDTTSTPVPTANFVAHVGTVWNNDWNDWDIAINGVNGTLSTTWTNDWDDWDFSIGGVNGDVSTTWSNNWNDWKLTTSGYSIDISTTWTNDWRDWDIGHYSASWDADASTTFSSDWNYWDIYGDSVNVDVRTTWSSDWNDWDIDGSFGTTLPVQYKMAALFIPVITSVLKEQGVIP